MISLEPVTCFIGMGSNLGDPEQQLQRAEAAMAGLEQSNLIRVSPYYRSLPLGPIDQPVYLNAVAELETDLDPYALLRALQEIETRQERRREERWGPRTLDLDLLLYGGARIVSSLLTVPHPGLTERDFVLYPLADIAPDWLPVPGHGTLGELRDACPKRLLKD